MLLILFVILFIPSTNTTFPILPCKLRNYFSFNPLSMQTFILLLPLLLLSLLKMSYLSLKNIFPLVIERKRLNVPIVSVFYWFLISFLTLFYHSPFFLSSLPYLLSFCTLSYHSPFFLSFLTSFFPPFFLPFLPSFLPLLP